MVAAGSLASIFAWRVSNSARVRSLVQHWGAGWSGPTGPVQGTVHFWLRSVATMSVVASRSHSLWRQTSFPSFVKVTSHSTMPAPMSAPARYATSECSGNWSAAPRWPIEKSVGWKGPSLHRSNLSLSGPSSMPCTR